MVYAVLLMRTSVPNGLPTLSKAQEAAIARLFSPTVIRELAVQGYSSILGRLIGELSTVRLANPSESLSTLFDAAFSLMQREQYRHEYIYKSAITHRILLGRHSLQTSAMLTEFRVGQCKADVVILNGTSTVFEIKSERDNLDRLHSQIVAYRKVFANVNVITGANHIGAVLRTLPTDVGVMLLNDRFRISTVREAEDSPHRICPGTIFDSIQQKEAAGILNLNGIEVPELPNTKRYGVLKEKFEQLTPDQAHRGMVYILKRSRNLARLSELVDALPASLKAAVLSMRLRRGDHHRLANALNSSVSQAQNWV